MSEAFVAARAIAGRIGESLNFKPKGYHDGIKFCYHYHARYGSNNGRLASTL